MRRSRATGGPSEHVGWWEGTPAEPLTLAPLPRRLHSQALADVLALPRGCPRCGFATLALHALLSPPAPGDVRAYGGDGAATPASPPPAHQQPQASRTPPSLRQHAWLSSSATSSAAAGGGGAREVAPGATATSAAVLHAAIWRLEDEEEEEEEEGRDEGGEAALPLLSSAQSSQPGKRERPWRRAIDAAARAVLQPAGPRVRAGLGAAAAGGPAAPLPPAATQAAPGVGDQEEEGEEEGAGADDVRPRGAAPCDQQARASGVAATNSKAPPARQQQQEGRRHSLVGEVPPAPGDVGRVTDQDATGGNSTAASPLYAGGEEGGWGGKAEQGTGARLVLSEALLTDDQLLARFLLDALALARGLQQRHAPAGPHGAATPAVPAARLVSATTRARALFAGGTDPGSSGGGSGCCALHAQGSPAGPAELAQLEAKLRQQLPPSLLLPSSSSLPPPHPPLCAAVDAGGAAAGGAEAEAEEAARAALAAAERLSRAESAPSSSSSSSGLWTGGQGARHAGGPEQQQQQPHQGQAERVGRQRLARLAAAYDQGMRSGAQQVSVSGASLPLLMLMLMVHAFSRGGCWG